MPLYSVCKVSLLNQQSYLEQINEQNLVSLEELVRGLALLSEEAFRRLGEIVQWLKALATQ